MLQILLIHLKSLYQISIDGGGKNLTKSRLESGEKNIRETNEEKL